MKLNRKNADINNILDKKVAIICDSEEKELDFRRWAKQYVDNVWTEISYITKNIALNLEDIGVRFAGINWYIENNYEIYEWEIAEGKKIYTIKDVVENEGKLYKIAGSSGLHKYKYENGKLLTNSIIADSWITSVMDLKELLGVKFVEYKPEPKKITFEEALKEMEQGKVCRSLYSGTEYLLSNNHFEKLNRNYTTLSYKEIKEEWVVVNE